MGKRATMTEQETARREALYSLIENTATMLAACKLIEGSCPSGELFPVWNAAREATHAAWKAMSTRAVAEMFKETSGGGSE